MSLFASLQKLNARFMYTDTMTVSRQMPIQDKYGADAYETQIVYRDMPCRLAQSQKASIDITDSTAAYRQQMKVIAAPDISIMANDVLEIMHQGNLYRLRSALPYKYPIHQEIPVSLEEDA